MILYFAKHSDLIHDLVLDFNVIDVRQSCLSVLARSQLKLPQKSFRDYPVACSIQNLPEIILAHLRTPQGTLGHIRTAPGQLIGAVDSSSFYSNIFLIYAILFSRVSHVCVTVIQTLIKYPSVDSILCETHVRKASELLTRFQYWRSTVDATFALWRVAP